MLLRKCKTYRYCRTHPKCTAIHQTPAAPCFPSTLPHFPGMDGPGAPWGRAALTPPAWKGWPRSKEAVRIMEPFGRSHLWPLWQAQLLDMVGWVFFSPPELPCNRVNLQGIEGSVPVGTGGFLQSEDQLRARVAGWVLASHSLHTPVCPLCPRGEGIASQEAAAILQRAGSCVPGADMPRPLGQAPALGRALFRRAIMGWEPRH